MSVSVTIYKNYIRKKLKMYFLDFFRMRMESEEPGPFTWHLVFCSGPKGTLGYTVWFGVLWHVIDVPQGPYSFQLNRNRVIRLARGVYLRERFAFCWNAIGGACRRFAKGTEGKREKSQESKGEREGEKDSRDRLRVHRV